MEIGRITFGTIDPEEFVSLRDGESVLEMGELEIRVLLGGDEDLA